VVFTTGDQNVSGVKNFSSRPTVNGSGVMLSGEIAGTGYLTGYVSKTETGLFLTSENTGNFVTSSQTGAFTGTFYPYSANPAAYIQGAVVRPSNTGDYIDKGSSQVISGDKFFSGLVTIGEGNFSTGLYFPFLPRGFVLGGKNNTSNGHYNILAGGQNNTGSGIWVSVIGGIGNIASGNSASVFGGQANRAIGDRALVMGNSNSVTGSDSVIVGGASNKISGLRSSIIGGQSNTILGDRSTVLGQNVTVSGNDSIAIGQYITLLKNNAIVIAAPSESGLVSSSGERTLNIKADSGIFLHSPTYFYSRPTLNGTGFLLSGEASAADTGYLTGYLQKTETGSFATTGYVLSVSGNLQSQIDGIPSPSNVVFATGDQTITGVKNFVNRPTVNGSGILLSGEVGGSSGWVLGEFCFVDPTNGSDSNAGTSYSPFATASGAYAAGFTKMIIGPGDAGVINILSGDIGSREMFLMGFAGGDYQNYNGEFSFFPSPPDSNAPKTKVTIVNDAVTTNHIHIYSNKGVSMALSGRSSYYAYGSESQDTLIAPDFFVSNGLIESIYISGDNIATNPGYGGYVTLDDCVVFGPISMTPGTGEFGEFGVGGALAATYSRFFDAADIPQGTFRASHCVLSQTPSQDILSLKHSSTTGNSQNVHPNELFQAGATSGQAIVWSSALGKWTPSTIITGSVVRPSETGAFLTTGAADSRYALQSATGAYTGVFYPLSSNPSNYLVAADITNLASTGYVTGVSGHLQGQITTLNGQTGSYITGSVVRPSETGNFVTTSQTGQFYAASNPANYITGVDLSSYATTGYVTGVSGYLESLISASSAGVGTLNGLSGSLTIAGAGNNSVSVAGSTITVSGNTGFLAGYQPIGNYVPYNGATGQVDIGAQTLISHAVKADSSAGLQILSNNGSTGIVVGAGGSANVTAYGALKLDYATANKVPIIDANKNLIASSVTTGEVNSLTGVTAPIQGQFSALTSVTGSFALSSNTGAFLTTGVADNRYSLNTGIRGVYIDAGAMLTGAVSGATPLTLSVSNSGIAHDVYSFDPATTGFAQFKFKLADYNLGGLRAKFDWTTSGASGGVVWGIQAISVSDGDSLNVGWGAAAEVTDTFITGTGFHLTSGSPSFTPSPTPLSGDMLYFRVYRNVSDANDTLAVNAHLLGVSLQYTGTNISTW
jgi:hypothetical protein